MTDSATPRSIPSRRTAVGAIALAAVTPLFEKNPLKTIAARSAQGSETPVVLSMARLIVLAFAVAMVRQLWLAGVAGWPEATLSIAVVLAMPILSAMERARPEQVLELARTLMTRFGVGAVRLGGSVFSAQPSVASAAEPSPEPSKYDDHRDDDDGRV